MCSSEVLPVSPPSGMCLSNLHEQQVLAPWLSYQACSAPNTTSLLLSATALSWLLLFCTDEDWKFTALTAPFSDLVFISSQMFASKSNWRLWVACLTDPQYGLLHWDTQKSLKLFAVVQTCRTVFEKMGKQNYPELLNPSGHYVEQVKNLYFYPTFKGKFFRKNKQEKG